MTAPCPHYWRIETPNGPYSPGVCSLCGAEKQFRNYDPVDRDYSLNSFKQRGGKIELGLGLGWMR